MAMFDPACPVSGENREIVAVDADVPFERPPVGVLRELMGTVSFDRKSRHDAGREVPTRSVDDEENVFVLEFGFAVLGQPFVELVAQRLQARSLSTSHSAMMSGPRPSFIMRHFRKVGHFQAKLVWVAAEPVL